MSASPRNKLSKFPQKLWEAATFNEDGSIYWSSSGNSIIFRFDFLRNHFLPNGSHLFQTDNLSSFVRLLNNYGFRKVKKAETDLKGKPSGKLFLQYSRPFFQKGRSDLLSLIERRPMKTSRGKKPSVISQRLKGSLSENNNFEFREGVIHKKLDAVELARKNFSIVINKTLEAYKNGDKENFLQKTMTKAGIRELCETTQEKVVHISTQKAILQKSKNSNVWSLTSFCNKKRHYSRLVGDWNAEPLSYQGPFRVDHEVVVEYQEAEEHVAIQ